MDDDHPPERGRNVLGGPLEPCSIDPLTGYFRDGCCASSALDVADHLVCVQVTAAFLSFTKRLGNDLATPRPELAFPGLTPGDRWCVCVARWREAFLAGVAPPVVLAATHEETLRFLAFDDLKALARDLV